MASLIRAARASAPRRAIASVSACREFSAMLTPVEEFPGLPSTSPSKATAGTASVTTLSNGLTVVSETGSSTSTIQLTFPNGGSASESASESGAAIANQFMSFKSGSGLSSAVILRNLEDDGAKPFASASRTGATVGFTASKDKALRLIPLLATSSTYEKWDVRDAQATAKVLCNEAESTAQTVLSESIYDAAFGAQSGMGKSFYSTSASGSSIRSFRERAYVLNGAVVAATGIEDHESFVKAVEEGFSESNVGEAIVSTPSVFLGRESRVHAPSAGYTHVALAFEGPKSSALANVIQQCINVGSEGALSGFVAPGVVGAYSGSAPADASSAVDALVASITASPSAAIVNRAKGLAKAQAMFALEGASSSLADVMTDSVLENSTFSAAEISAAYDSITAQDVAAAFDAMAKSSPAMASVGDLSSTPYQGSISAKFG
eukprot:CAMPEP_0194083334 /NCGR_PEP_ID=MMETSP0149-20130528/8985_1 /TAXON_ID=122233 /ORGANISM="Chaetoceros debilis, Strain MM31A-1" /LENGTH=435 /DNA_ID=CAMNT_0038765719 /DNA_START=38 /DNA_END=1345 /DNA_ORIENTATION=+